MHTRPARRTGWGSSAAKLLQHSSFVVILHAPCWVRSHQCLGGSAHGCPDVFGSGTTALAIHLFLQSSCHGSIVFLLGSSGDSSDAMAVAVIVVVHGHVTVIVIVRVDCDDAARVFTTSQVPGSIGGRLSRGGVCVACEVGSELGTFEEQLNRLHLVVAGDLEITAGDPLVVGASDGHELSDVFVHDGQTAWGRLDCCSFVATQRYVWVGMKTRSRGKYPAIDQ